jgi:hypothetical protein
MVGLFSGRKRKGNSPNAAYESEIIKNIHSILADMPSRDVFGDLIADSATGIELGVAFGGFSKRLLERNSSLFLYGVDMYAGDRGHDVSQYKAALRNTAAFRDRYNLLRARFDEILDLFEDEYFDFMYVDGYAHTGEEGGQTFRDWFSKVKPFGIFAGDDYHPDWPLVVQEVDEFLRENDLPLLTIANTAAGPGVEWSQWFTIKGPRNDPRYVEALSAIFERANRSNLVISGTQIAGDD